MHTTDSSLTYILHVVHIYIMCDFFPDTSCGDPRFMGGDGNTFYFHGHKDQSSCLPLALFLSPPE
jgi:hypothetical protein